MGHNEKAIEVKMELNGEEIVEQNGGSESLYEIKSISISIFSRRRILV